MTGDWTVLLIGGPAAVGKTSAAKRLAVISGAALLQADDVWLALQGAIGPQEDPALHFFADRDVWRRPVTELVAAARAIADRVSASLEPVVGHHLTVEDRVVIEGVWLTPAFASRESYAGGVGGRRRRSVFVLEDDPARIKDAMEGRGRGFGAWSAHDRGAMAALQAGYARWLRSEAKERSLPIVPARPAGHLAERILSVL